jgi:hypothetical protein
MAGRNRDTLGVERAIVTTSASCFLGGELYTVLTWVIRTLTPTLTFTTYSYGSLQGWTPQAVPRKMRSTLSKSLLHYFHHPVVQLPRVLSESLLHNPGDVFLRNIVINQSGRQAQRIDEAAVSAARSALSVLRDGWDSLGDLG